MDAEPQSSTARAYILARALGYLGLLPFVATTAILFVRDDGTLTRNVIFALSAYGALILTFLGAVHWGRALFDTSLTHRQTSFAFSVSVMPSAFAWLALLMPVAVKLLLLALGFAVIYGYDRVVFRTTAHQCMHHCVFV